MRPGEMTEAVGVLELRRHGEAFRWAAVRTAWAKVETAGKTNLFSKVGLGAASVVLTLHRQSLSLHNALLWRGRHLFLTDIREKGLLYLEIEAAVIEPVSCLAEPDRVPPGGVFPGVLTEKYLRHEQGEPMATNALCYVLVTPKAVRLTPGHLVAVGEEPYQVLVEHGLDPYKNEYEMMRTRDL